MLTRVSECDLSWPQMAFDLHQKYSLVLEFILKLTRAKCEVLRSLLLRYRVSDRGFLYLTSGDFKINDLLPPSKTNNFELNV